MLDSATKTRRGKSGNAMEATSTMTPRASTLRWEILRRAVLRRPPPQPGSSLLHRCSPSHSLPRHLGFQFTASSCLSFLGIALDSSISLADDQSRIGINRISRKTSHGFNLIPHHLMDGHDEHFSGSDRSRDARICYTLPVESASKLYLTWVYNFICFVLFYLCHRLSSSVWLLRKMLKFWTLGFFPFIVSNAATWLSWNEGNSLKSKI